MRLTHPSCHTSLQLTHPPQSTPNLLRSNLGRILHKNTHSRRRLRTRRGYPDTCHRLRIHSLQRAEILATFYPRVLWRQAGKLGGERWSRREDIRDGVDGLVYGVRRRCPSVRDIWKVLPLPLSTACITQH